MKKIGKIILVNLTILVILLSLVEYSLHLKGYKPEYPFGPTHFKIVPELYDLKGYMTDSLGIMKIDTSIRTHVANQIKANEGEYDVVPIDQKYWTAPFYIGYEFMNLRTGIYKGAYSLFIDSLKRKVNPDNIDLAYLEYARLPINKEGFRSISFQNHQTDKIKILILGDSFAYGMEANNILDGFADLLSTKGYVVYNTGIGGADLPQYHAICARYISEIKPDIVIVNVYLGNDITFLNRPLIPYVPILFPTNAGNLYSFQEGVQFYSPESVYEHVLKMMSIKIEDRFLSNFAAKTRIGTLVWYYLCSKDLIHNCENEYYTKFIIDEIGLDYDINCHYLEKIRLLSEANGAKLITSIIPQSINLNIPENDLNEQLSGFDYELINGLTERDYARLDGHFNNQGYRKYADFLDSLIQIRIAEKDK